MPSNLDLVRSIYAAWDRGDFSTAEWAHPDIEYVIADGPEPGSYRGLDAMTAAWRDRTIPWAHVRVEAEKYRELDDERVLVLSHWAGRGKTSGMDLGQLGSKGASLFEIRDCKVTRIVAY
jgi:ketosteroid isomerase-like protein